MTVRHQGIGAGAVAAALVGLTLVARVGAADFKPPENEEITDAQVSKYLTITRGQQDLDAAFAQQVKDKGAAVAAAVAVEDWAKKKDALYAANGMPEDECRWVGDRLTDAFRYLVWDQQQKKIADEMQAQMKDQDDKVAAAKQKLATYQAAQKDGRRVLTAEQRDSAIASAKDELKAAQEESRQHADEARTAAEEARQHDAEAKAADDLAKSPPADVAADDRPSYVDGKKNDGQSARDAAKEARGRADEANKVKAESDARAAVAQRKIDHPDAPATDDEKAQVKQENDQAIADAQAEIDRLAQQQSLTNTQTAAIFKGTEDLKGKVPENNVKLLRAHLHDYVTANHMEAFELEKPATTQPK